MTKTVIVAGARTPFGKFGGALAPLTAAQLGGIAIKEAVKRAEIEGKDVQEVIIGNVLQGGQGQLPSDRQCEKQDFLGKRKRKRSIKYVHPAFAV